MLKTAKSTRDYLAENTKVTERMKETVKDFAIDGIGALAGALGDSPLLAMTAQFIGDKLRDKRERKRADMETMRTQILKQQESLLEDLVTGQQFGNEQLEQAEKKGNKT